MKKKNLIVQLNIPYRGENYVPESIDLKPIRIENPCKNDFITIKSMETVKSYAKRIGADYDTITQWKIRPEKENKYANIEKVQIFFDDKYLEYDNVLYLDLDVIVNPHVKVPNIFTEYPQNCFKVIHGSHGLESIHGQLPSFSQEEVRSKMFNSGVMLFSRDTILLFRKHFNTQCVGGDQMALNVCAIKYNIPMMLIEKKWNLKMWNTLKIRNNRRNISSFFSYLLFHKNNYFFHFNGSKKGVF